jgi:predicted kinase
VVAGERSSEASPVVALSIGPPRDGCVHSPLPVPRGYYVVVSGNAGSGKTTLAVPLAAELQLPLISKDSIKEALADELGLGDDAWSQRLGAASFEVLYALAATAPAAVLETSWHRKRCAPRLRQLDKPVLEVFCHCPAPVRAHRLRVRAATDRHPIHREMITPALLGRLHFVPARPLGIGPVLRVDTARDVDIVSIATWVRAQLRA